MADLYTDTLADLNAVDDGLRLPRAYLGNIATRCMMPRGLMSSGAGRWQTTRSFQIARDKVVNPIGVFPAWRQASNVESYPGAGQIKVGLEYPIGSGTCYLATENIPGSVAFPTTGGLLLGTTALTFPVTIPEGGAFGFRPLMENVNGTVFQQYQSDYVPSPYEAWETGTGAVSDKTVSGSFTANVIGYNPIAVLGMTRKRSFLLLGDSTGEGGSEGRSDATCDVGYMARAIGRQYGYTSLCESGTWLAQWLAATRTYRNALIATGWYTDIINGYGLNDLGTGRTVDQLVADCQTFNAAMRALSPGIRIGRTTLLPYLGTTDGYQTVANQNIAAGSNVKVRAFNPRARSGETGEDYVIDLAKVVDPAERAVYPVDPNPFATAYGAACTFTASISGTTVTVSAVSSGSISLYKAIISNLTGWVSGDVEPGTIILEQLSGTAGSTGTYRVNKSQTKTSRTMYHGGAMTPDGLHGHQELSHLLRDSPAFNTAIKPR